MHCTCNICYSLPFKVCDMGFIKRDQVLCVSCGEGFMRARGKRYKIEISFSRELGHFVPGNTTCEHIKFTRICWVNSGLPDSEWKCFRVFLKRLGFTWKLDSILAALRCLLLHTMQGRIPWYFCPCPRNFDLRFSKIRSYAIVPHGRRRRAIFLPRQARSWWGISKDFYGDLRILALQSTEIYTRYISATRCYTLHHVETLLARFFLPWSSRSREELLRTSTRFQ